MTKARRDSVYLMLLGSVFFLLFGFVLVSTRTDPVQDFRTAYYRGTCLLQHCDPYNGMDIERVYKENGEPPFASDRVRLVVTRNIYLPTEFPFLIPLALMPIRAAEALWLSAIAGSFIFSSYLMWVHGAELAPLLSASLLAFCLANSGSLLFFGNPAGFVVPLAVIAVWCILQERFVYAGILCLAISLLVKPHDAALIWLFLLLAGGSYRRRALQTLALASAICLPTLLWLTQLSPHWLQELSANVRLLSVRGAVSDPSGGHGTCMMTNLQTVTSFFWDDPRTYDLVSYLICAPFLLFGAFVAWKSRPTRETMWLGLAALAPFSMLPVYHRQYDAKLIILAIPALAALWARRSKLAWVGVFVTTAAFILNGDLPWVIFLATIKKLHLSTEASYGRLLTAVWDFPVPLSLLAMGSFYLWIYARASFGSAARGSSSEHEQAQAPSAVAS